MPTESTLQQKIARGITGGLFVGLTIWIGLLIRASMIVRASSGSMVYNVTVGPLSLTTISKHTADHGYTATISPQFGLFWLLVGCLVIGGLLGWILQVRSSE